MYRHGPNSLRGPVGRWSFVNRGEVLPDDSTRETPGESADSELFRVHLVERVRQELALGVYDTEEKWELALDRLADRLVCR